MDVNITKLSDLIATIQDEKEQAIATAYANVEQEVVFPKYAELDTMYDEAQNKASEERQKAIQLAESMCKRAIEKADTDYSNTLAEAQKIVHEKKEQIATDQRDNIRRQIGSAYDAYINDLNIVLKKHNRG